MVDEPNAELETYPGFSVHSKRWDATWILNRAMRDSEEYGTRIIIRVRGKGTVNVDVFLAAAGGIVVGEVLRLTADDLYRYTKRVIERAHKKKRKVEVSFNERWRKEDLPYQ
jgi:hypothetical protein